MPRLIAALIRHGDYQQLPATPSAHQPFPLTAQGETQARAAVAGIAERVNAQGWRIDPIIDSSRLLRAWQTASLIADGLAGAQRVEEFDALAERGLGIAANLRSDQIEAVLAVDPRYPVPPPGWKANSGYRLPLPGAESLLEAGARVAAHLNARMQQLSAIPASGDRLKLFVGHGAALRHAAYHLGVLDYPQIAALSMYHARPVYLERQADGAWRHIAGDWKQRRASDTHTD